MLNEYRQHVAERAALGIPPLALDAKQTAELIELIKNPPAGEEEFLMDLLTYRVPPGVDDAAKVKASFLAAVAHGDIKVGLISRAKATELLGTMLGGYNVHPLIELLDDPEVGGVAANALKKTLLMFDFFNDVAAKAKAGNAKEDGVRRIVEHLGSAHNKTELAALLEVGRQKIAAEQGQGLLDLESLEPAAGRTGLASTTVETKRSGLLWDVLHGVCTRLGPRKSTGGDRAFEQMVLARLIEPTSKAQVPRVLGDLGLESVSVRTLFRSLCRCGQRGYREAISQALFDHVTASGGLALCLQA